MFADEPVLLDSSTMLSIVLSEYFQNNSPVNVTVDGRIVNCADAPTNPLCSGSSNTAGAA